MSIEKGAKLFQTKCMNCHNVDKGGKGGQGPNLWGIVGNRAGTDTSFQYTSANKDSGVIWDKKTLSTYLKNPKKFMPGTKMVFAGFSKKRDRRDIIAFLESNGPQS
eukprot:149225_1